MSKSKPSAPPRRPVPAEGPMPAGKNTCVFCKKRLDISGQSIASVANGAACSACAKNYDWKGLICPPAVRP